MISFNGTLARNEVECGLEHENVKRRVTDTYPQGKIKI